MTDIRSTLDDTRQTILAEFELQAGRAATPEELETIATKSIRRGAGVFCVIKKPEDLYLVALSIQGSHYKTAGKLTATGGGLMEESDTDTRVAALRELSEEVKDDQGNPVLKDINPDNLVFLSQRVDVKMLLPDAPHPEWDIVMAEVYYTILNRLQTEDLEAHIHLLDSDPEYRAASYASTNHENGGVWLVPLEEATKPHFVECLQHVHEQDGFALLPKKLGLVA